MLFPIMFAEVGWTVVRPFANAKKENIAKNNNKKKVAASATTVHLFENIRCPHVRNSRCVHLVQGPFESWQPRNAAMPSYEVPLCAAPYIRPRSLYLGPQNTRSQIYGHGCAAHFIFKSNRSIDFLNLNTWNCKFSGRVRVFSLALSIQFKSQWALFTHFIWGGVRRYETAGRPRISYRTLNISLHFFFILRFFVAISHMHSRIFNSCEVISFFNNSYRGWAGDVRAAISLFLPICYLNFITNFCCVCCCCCCFFIFFFVAVSGCLCQLTIWMRWYTWPAVAEVPGSETPKTPLNSTTKLHAAHILSFH